MTKRTVTPLLAVIALGLGGVASADRKPTSVAAIKPRALRSGAPACANVLDKDNQPLSRLHPDYPTCKPDHPNNQPKPSPSDPAAIAAVFGALGLDEAGLERPVFEHERR